MKDLRPLPKSDDEYWEGAEKHTSQPVISNVCPTHKNFMEHEGYIDNGDGTASCIYCSWGFRLPGYLRIKDGKVFDLRKK